MEKNYVIASIKQNAKKQVFSKEVLEVLVMLTLVLFCMFKVIPYSGGNKGIAISICCVLVLLTAFGVYDTFPAIVCYLYPYGADFLRCKKDRYSKEIYVAEINTEIRKGYEFSSDDFDATENFIIFHGERSFEVIRKSEVVSISVDAFPNRKMYKGVYLLKINTHDGKKHVLDMHNGKLFNPVKQINMIIEYVENDLPDVVVKKPIFKK